MDIQKTPTEDVESRQCKGLLDYTNQFENCLLTKKHNYSVAKASIQLNRFAHHELVSIKRSMLHMIIVCPDIPCLQKLFLSLKRFFYWPRMYKWVQTVTKSCPTCRKNEQIRRDQNTASNEKRGEEVPY